MPAAKTKVIVVGDVRGDLSAVRARVEKLNAAGKGPFNVVICVGEFSKQGDAAAAREKGTAGVSDGRAMLDGSNEKDLAGTSRTFADYISGRATLPFKLYFLLSGTSPDADLTSAFELSTERQDLSPGITFLGQASVSTIEGGIRIAALSGDYDRNSYRSTSESSPGGAAEAGGSEVGPEGEAAGNRFRSKYRKLDIDAMLASKEAHKPVDMLLSCEWGEGYDALIPQSSVRPLPHKISPVVADLARRLMPRHHLVTGKFCFFKLDPYVNTDSTDGTRLHVTRFVALGSVPSTPAGVESTAEPASKPKPKPAKWMHALNLEPMEAMTEVQRNKAVSGATTSPYLASLLKKIGGSVMGVGNANSQSSHAGPGAKPSMTNQLLRPVGAPPPLLQLPSASPPNLDASRAALMEAASDAQSMKDGARQRFAQPKRKRRRNGDGGQRGDGSAFPSNKIRKRKKMIPPRMDCWFCCASPTCETHLIVSIAQHMYLTAPKGALSPGHMLIVPVAHLASMADADEEAQEEICKYKDSLRNFYGKHGEVPIFVERCVKTKGPQQHAYIEAIPMPKDAAAKLLPGAFAEECKKCKMDFSLLESKVGLAAAAPADRQYFHIEMPSRIQMMYAVPPERGSIGGKNMVHLQFARKLACCVLGCPERMHWKSCVVSPQVEMQLANEFKGAFGGGGFDWTQEDLGGGAN